MSVDGTFTIEGENGAVLGWFSHSTDILDFILTARASARTRLEMLRLDGIRCRIVYRDAKGSYNHDRAGLSRDEVCFKGFKPL